MTNPHSTTGERDIDWLRGQKDILHPLDAGSWSIKNERIDRIIEALSRPSRMSASSESEPVAWRYTIQYETGETRSLVTDEERSPFGVPGKDYSEEYAVTCEPLYSAHPVAVPVSEEMVEAMKGLIALYEDDEGAADLPQIIAAKAALAALAVPDKGVQGDQEALPQNVIDLVIAAREYIYTSHQPDDEGYKAVDAALEAFASRVPWDDEPEDSLAQASEGGAS